MTMENCKEGICQITKRMSITCIFAFWGNPQACPCKECLVKAVCTHPCPKRHELFRMIHEEFNSQDEIEYYKLKKTAREKTSWY